MTQAMSNVERMMSKPFKGGFLRLMLNEKLCDQVGIYEGMRLDAQTLGIMLEKANEREPIDFSHILTVKSCAGRRYVQRLDDVPNLRMFIGGGRQPSYFTLAPGKLYEWADYDDSIRNLYRIVAPLIFKQMGIEISGANLQRIQETLNFVCPVFWFEYNFVTKRFNMRTPTGVIVRRIKQSQYGVFFREPKMVIAIEEHNHYALAMHTNKDIVLGEWLNHEDNMMAWQLETEMSKHMSSVGWNAELTTLLNEQAKAREALMKRAPKRNMEVIAQFTQKLWNGMEDDIRKDHLSEFAYKRMGITFEDPTKVNHHY